MEIAVLSGIVVLFLMTGVYVWFSYRTLHEVRRENHLYRGIIERQLNISTTPYLHCDLTSDSSSREIKIEIYNIGYVPAHDIHASAIGAYTEEIMDISALMRTCIQPRYRKYPLQADKVGYYGIRGSFRAPILPFQKRLAIAFNLPIQPIDIYMLLQYRDILGSNYYQIYCFSDLDKQGKYRANLYEPKGFETIDRLHFYDADDANFSMPDKTIPYYLKDFIDLWNHSLSYQLTTLYSEETTPQHTSMDVQAI
ncbi:MAG: hypothetical protein ACFE0J_07290 [Elainellaceae cyanobacterium]